MCPQCGAQYRVVEALRGLLCLCSPDITRGLQAIGAGGASNVRPALLPPTASRAAPQKQAAPRVAATACVALSPARCPPGEVVGDSEGQGKLIMLVDDFYYGQDEGRGVLASWDSSQQGPVQFRCLHCSKKLKNNVRLMNHMRHHVELEQQVGEVDTHSSCQHCYRQFPTPFRLQCHLESVHSQYESTTKCKICEWAYDTEPLFLQHMKSNHSPGEMPYVCQVCEFRSSVYSDVINHFRNWHKDTANLLCPYCLKVFKTSNNYQHHYSRHQKKSVSHCDKCRLQFLSTREKLEHKTSHHKSFRKPRQLQGLKPGTTVTIRAYAEENRPVGIVKTGLLKTAAVKHEPATRAVATPSAKKQPIAKRRPMYRLQEVLTKFQEEREALGKQSCLECTFDIPDFSSHFPTSVTCSLCHYCTCCSRAYANHMINNHVSRKTSTKYLALYKAGPRWSELVCTACPFATRVGDEMAKHLAKNPTHSASYCTLKGPPVRRLESQSHGDLAARALPAPDVGQSVQPMPVSTRTLPFPVPVHPDPDEKAEERSFGGGGAGGGGGESPGGPVRVLLFALCCGVPRAAQRFGAPASLIWTWLLERERGLEPGGGAGGGAGGGVGGGAGGKLEEELAEWVQCRREQQLPVHEKNLYRKMADLFRGQGDPKPARDGWTVDFLLRWRLGAHATAGVSRPLSAVARERARSFMKSFRRRLRDIPLPLGSMGAMDELSVFVNFDLLAAPPSSLSSSFDRKQFAFHLSGTGPPLCDVFLSAMADGALLPALVVPRRVVPDGLRPPPAVLLGPAAAAGASEEESSQEQLGLWLSRAWPSRAGAVGRSRTLLVMDVHRGHAHPDFLQALRKAGALTAVVPAGCSSRLQPLEVCAAPALRAFLEARWSRLVEGGGAEGGVTPARALQLVLDWLGEAMAALGGAAELLRRSFRCCGLAPPEPGDGEPGDVQSELLRALTKVLMGPGPYNPLPPEPEEETAERGSGPDTSVESSAVSPRRPPPPTPDRQALRSIFEKDSDAESFLGFEESEISAVYRQ